MKNLLTICLCLILSVCATSQHEFKLSAGPTSSFDSDFGNIFDQIMIGFDSTAIDYSTSNRIGIDIRTSYSYYIKHNLKISANLSYQQFGYNSMESYEFGSGFYQSQQYTEATRKIDLIGFGSSVTYITDYDISLTIGGSSLLPINDVLQVSGSVYYPNNLSEGFYIDELTTYETPSMFATYIGIGYEFGDLTFDVIYTPSLDTYPGMSATSFLIGYSHLIIKK